MLATLQSLRILFVMLIFMSHFKYGNVPALVGGGDCGVAFFFILSGFLLSLKYDEQIEQCTFDAEIFYRKRLIKVYPLHWLCLIVYLFLWTFDWNRRLLANVLLVQSWFPDNTYYYSYNAVSWFLSDILFCYLLFPLLSRWNIPKRIFLLLFIYVVCLWFVPDDLVTSVLYINPLARLVDFILGMTLCQYFRKWREHPIPYATLLEIGCLLLIPISLWLDSHLPPQLSNAPLYWLVAVPCIFVFSCGKGRVSKFLAFPIISCFGRYVLPFFMTHIIVLQILSGLIRCFSYEIGWLAFLLLSVLITLFFSYLIERFFLNPLLQQFHRS